jgi:hypothetical protein
VVKSKRLRWAGHLVQTGMMKINVTFKRKRLREIPRAKFIRVRIFKMDLKKSGCKMETGFKCGVLLPAKWTFAFHKIGKFTCTPPALQAELSLRSLSGRKLIHNYWLNEIVFWCKYLKCLSYILSRHI